MRKKALGYYDYTVILTYCGGLAAFCGILRVIGMHFRDALFCLMLAGICDMFDGAIASTKSRTADEKNFGIQIDSMNDLVSFGILPALFVYMLSGQNPFVGIISAFFALCALIRLSYFNVLEANRQRQTVETRKTYLGLPVTTVAILLPLLYMLYDYERRRIFVCFPILLILMGICFLLPVEIKKPRLLGKICLILLGIFEALGMILFMGWDIL